MAEESSPAHKRICDYCGDATALLHCRADSAKLCFSCDREVHSTNQLFSKHTRSLLCDACDSSSAAIFCETEQSVLCQNCDWEKHKVSGCSLHDRRPFEGFSGCPNVNELLSVIGFEDVENKVLLLGGGDDSLCSDIMLWESPAVVNLDDLIGSTCTEQHNFQASVVPSLPKNRNATCGQHIQQILHQLRELEKREPNCNIDYTDFESILGFESIVPEQVLQTQNDYAINDNNSVPSAYPASEANTNEMFSEDGGAINRHSNLSTISRSNSQENSMVPDDFLDAGGGLSHDPVYGQTEHIVGAETSSILPKRSSQELHNQDRDLAISRYKEKRKTRRYDKVIRYESRKARAESRTRIRGRFAKINQ